MGRWTPRKMTVRFESADGAHFVIVGPGPGDLNIPDISASNKVVVPKRDRQAHDGFVETDDAVQACSISTELENKALTSTSAKTVLDFIRRKGVFADAVSVSEDTWAWRTICELEDEGAYAKVTLPECQGGTAFAEGAEGATLTTNFSNYVEPIWE